MAAPRDMKGLRAIILTAAAFELKEKISGLEIIHRDNTTLQLRITGWGPTSRYFTITVRENIGT